MEGWKEGRKERRKEERKEKEYTERKEKYIYILYHIYTKKKLCFFRKKCLDIN